MLNFVGFYIVTLFLFGLWKSNVRLADIEAWILRIPFVLKLLFSLVLALYLLNQSFALFNNSLNNSLHFLITKPSFFVHEAGHVYFRLFGNFMSVAGGTICELAAPLAILLLSLHRRFFSTASLSLFWLGQILLGVADYIKSAPTNSLHPDLYGTHDWHYLLSTVDLLAYAGVLSQGVWIAGIVLMFAGLSCFITTVLISVLSSPSSNHTEAIKTPLAFPFFSLIRHYFRRYLLQFFISPGKGNELFDLTMRILTQVAAIDGKISAAEISGIERFAKYELGLSPERLVILLQQLRGLRRVPGDYQESFTELYLAVNGNKVLIEAIFDVVIAMAHADDHFSSIERELWEKAGEICHLSPADLDRLLARHKQRSAFSQGPIRSSRSARYSKGRTKHRRENSRAKVAPQSSQSSQNCYDILGIDQNDSLETIKKKYRQLVKETHPDALLAMGAPIEFRKTAEARFREIQEAYEEICRQKK